MIRFILCFKSETASPKLRTDRRDMKMVPHLTLLFGLFCAGAVAEWASWDYAEDSAAARSSEMELIGIDPRTKNCNECKKTVTEIMRNAKEGKKIAVYTKHFYPCPYFVGKQNEICKNVMVYVRESFAINYMDYRGICAKAKYCTKKYSNKASRPLVLSSSNNRDWSGRKDQLEGRRCKSRKNEESTALAAKNEPSLDLSNFGSSCQECKNVVTEMKLFIGSSKVDEYFLTYACGEFDSDTQLYCFELIERYGQKIVSYLNAKKSEHEICYAIHECPPKKFTLYCKACSTYVQYGKVIQYVNDPWEQWACSDFKGNDQGHCIKALKSNKIQILEHLSGNPNPNPNRICQKAGLCAHLLLEPNQHN